MKIVIADIPSTMLVAELWDVDDLRIVQRPTPGLQAGELMVRIAASGICSGDLMPWYIRRKAPLVLGHEPTGTIIKIGEGAEAFAPDGSKFEIGDRVAIHHHAPCLICRACRRKAYVQCATWRSSRIDPGGIAEYVRIPRENLCDIQKLPAHVAWDEAVLVEPLGCVMKSLRRAALRAGDIVYVIGLGVMGLLHVAVLRARGFTVVASDFIAARRDLAMQLGAVAAVEPDAAASAIDLAGNSDGADVVICGPGSAQALAHACEQVGRDGVVVMFTPLAPQDRFSMDQSNLYFRDIQLISSYSCGPNDTAEALAFLAAGNVNATNLNVQGFPLRETARAYKQMMHAEIIKAIIRF